MDLLHAWPVRGPPHSASAQAETRKHGACVLRLCARLHGAGSLHAGRRAEGRRTGGQSARCRRRAPSCPGVAFAGELQQNLCQAPTPSARRAGRRPGKEAPHTSRVPLRSWCVEGSPCAIAVRVGQGRSASCRAGGTGVSPRRAHRPSCSAKRPALSPEHAGPTKGKAPQMVRLWI
jgi:hypothetical protein